jgi:hypothetical protein
MHGSVCPSTPVPGQYCVWRSRFCLALILGHFLTQGETLTTVAYAEPAPAVAVESAKGRLFIDATLSMAGFASAKPDTVFAEALQSFESSAQEVMRHGTVDYFAFGGTTGMPKTISIGREAFVKKTCLRSGDLYTNRTRGVWQTTYLPEAIHGVASDEFAVFITDLFTDEADSVKLGDELRAHAAAGSAVGILGFRSAFNGKVYDVGLTGASFPLSGPRNFFAIVVGYPTQVRRFIDRVSSDFKGDSSPKTFTLQTHADAVAIDADAVNVKPVALAPTSNLVPKESYKYQYRVSPDAREPKLDLTWPAASGQGTEELGLRSELKLEIQDGGQWVTPKAGNTPIDIPATVPFALKAPNLAIKLKRNLLSPGRIYRCKISLHSDFKAPDVPSWIADWDMDIPTAKATPPPKSKLPLAAETLKARGDTANLRRLYNLLADTIPEKESTTVTGFTFLFILPE